MSASMYPVANSLPLHILAPRTDGDFTGPDDELSLEKATVAQLRVGIALQQAEVRRVADGLPQLCSLLIRRLMEGATDADPAMADPDDPVRDHHERQAVTRHLAEVEQNIAAFDGKAEIDRALTLAGRAFDDASKGEDKETAGLWLRIELNKRSEPLIRALSARQIGQINIQDFAYHIDSRDLFRGRKKRAHHWVAMAAAVEAFALEMSKPGFEFQIMSYDD